MAELQMGMVESKFADIIWQYAPVTSSQLVKLGEMELGWKRTTVHTVLRRLCDKGLFQNDGGLVTVRMSREDFYARQSRQFVQDSFHGSLPAFIAAFTQGRQLSEKEREEIRRMIDGVGGNELWKPCF